MLKRWNAFQAAHGRPSMLYADLLDPSGRQRRFTLLGTLAQVLNLKGDYALMPGPTVIRIAFERKNEANAFAEAVLARKTAREAGWAGQWAFVLDDLMEEKIRAMLPPRTRRTPEKPT